SKPRKPETTIISSTAAAKTGANAVYINDPKHVGLKNPFMRDENRLQIDSQLNPSYTIDGFVEGDCNRLAKSAGMAISLKPGGTAFNPLLIYGGSGLGKTHLAQAIGQEIKRNYPEKIVLYVSTNLFQTQFTEAIRKNEINDFLHFYQLLDVLILDDIHELAGKTATQNTFFHIFNHLQHSGKQLILTCDKAPADLIGIEDRLLSRFKWGLSAEIKQPDFDTRKEIMQCKAKKDGIDFAPEIIDYICKNVNNNVRELEGTMISLLAQATFNKKDLTIDLVKEVLGKTVRIQEKELTVTKIQEVVCDYFHIEPSMLQEKTRKREIVQARYLAMYFCKKYTKSSLAFIGNQIGNKDHATVLYACKVVSDMIDTDRKFKTHVEELQKKLYAY
ncbi:chromosomal replication initiator protein DnaA, partial [Porphyromonadaceae bacterium OttesenSCG-928-L07]|nr:chromosomal replication initiator protein DnaA [Porphyromonadaceae bacterium OttesenSCG-928-L07]